MAFDRAPEAAPPTPEVLEGVVERLVYSSTESGWTVLRLKVDGRRESVTAVGRLLGLQEGENVRLSGAWTDDARYGRQFRVDSYLPLAPKTLAGIRRYLGSGLIRGIGKVLAERLVREFGLRTLEVIEDAPERLAQVPGIGPLRSERIRKAWGEQREMRDLMVFLQSHGITTGQAVRIYKRYGRDAVAAVRLDPYRLATEIWGIGFRTADRIGASLGIPRDSPLRAAGGLVHALEEASQDGHLYLPRGQLVREAAELLEMPPPTLEEALDRQLGEGRLLAGGSAADPAIYLPALHAAEHQLAADLRRLLAAPAAPADTAIDEDLARFEAREELELAPHQREAIRRAVAERVLVITGGPGTGKTTLIRAVVRLLATRGRRLLLAAPTGRAAKRLAEATGCEAKTLHRLLEIDPRIGSFQRHRERPLDADVVVVDEVSMLDCPLAAALLAALPAGARLILVGDADQLPSVGPGRVLDDLIRCGAVPVVRLERVFRQAASSLIVANAHRIQRGHLPEAGAQGPESDFFFIERAQPEQILETVKQLVAERIPRGFDLDPREDLQVLTPMRRGLLGADHLNLELQRLLNPRGQPVANGGGRLRLGDRVMQVRNNYDLEVFNGDIGRATSFDEGEGLLRVMVDDLPIDYDRADLEDLVLAYACSVHKAQGSEYPCVVMPIHPQHRLLLQRNLLYTAVTRARRLMVLVGSRAAVAMAVRNDRRLERYSRLGELLAGGG